MEWRPVLGWEHKYEVSDRGDVRNITNGVEVKAHSDKGGYRQVNLLDYPTVRKLAKVHHLVSAAFIGCRPPGYDVHHIDGNKENNTADNLEYVLHGKHSSSHKCGEKHPQSKLTKSQVSEIKAMLTEGVPQRSIADKFGVHFATISRISTGSTWARDH